MRVTDVMENNRDTAGWGIIGTVWVMATSPPSLWEKVGTGMIVAGAGWLGSYIVKKAITYAEAKTRRWLRRRRLSKAMRTKELHEESKNYFGRIRGYVGACWSKLRTK